MFPSHICLHHIRRADFKWLIQLCDILNRATVEGRRVGVQVISPTHIYLGTKARLVVQVNTELQNITHRVTSDGSNCVKLYEQQYAEFSAGRCCQNRYQH